MNSNNIYIVLKFGVLFSYFGIDPANLGNLDSRRDGSDGKRIWEIGAGTGPKVPY